ncbi:MAG TPA: hypothetical protein VE982_02355 [Gaiellaceae bacterium]|nr:hypothetical protein [Gaiellaceae bacterium]
MPPTAGLARSAPARPAATPAQRAATLGGAVAVAALAVAFWGAYDRHWRWTGLRGRADVWDWLHVLVLPVAFALTPLWFPHRQRLGRSRHVLLALFAGAFSLLVVLGYALHLRWTGFPGNTLWDWLELLVLPLAVVLLPVWVELADNVKRRHLAAAACVVAALVVTAIGGYAYDWRWTGFHGNTLYDWLSLLVAPLALPLVLAPLATRWFMAEAGEEASDRGSAA